MQTVAFRNEKGETEPGRIPAPLLPGTGMAVRLSRCRIMSEEEPAAAVAKTAELWYNYTFIADKIVRTIPDEKISGDMK